MIVVDASALLEFLLQTALGTRVEALLFRDRNEFHTPHLADVHDAPLVTCDQPLTSTADHGATIEAIA